MAKGPYKAIAKPGTREIAYWILTDTRTGELVSYPTTERNAKQEQRIMNRLYAEYETAAASVEG